MGFLEQAFSGPAEVSFLPIYYSLQSLAKIVIVLNGKGADIEMKKNRFHGATYVRKTSYDLLTEEITLKSNGIIALFYLSLVGENWGTSDHKIKMKDIYPFISGISHEYSSIYNKPFSTQPVELKTSGNEVDGFFLELNVAGNLVPNGSNLRYLKIVKGFRRKSKDNDRAFIGGRKIKAKKGVAKKSLESDIRRILLSTSGETFGNPRAPSTPVSNKRLLLPEEFPILLAFFHLSNVVRYNPEFLVKIKDSKAWSMLLNMRQDSVYRYLVLFWSYLQQEVFIITSD